MTNHSSSAYQIVIIAVRKEYQIDDLLKGIRLDFLPIREDEIEELEDSYKIDLLSLLDRYNIYQSWTSSEDEHGFYEDGGYGHTDIMEYWEDWLEKEAWKRRQLEKLDKDKVKVLYYNQDYT